MHPDHPLFLFSARSTSFVACLNATFRTSFWTTTRQRPKWSGAVSIYTGVKSDPRSSSKLIENLECNTVDGRNPTKVDI